MNIKKSTKNFVRLSEYPHHIWKRCLKILEISYPPCRYKGELRRDYSLKKVSLDILEQIFEQAKTNYKKLVKQFHPDYQSSIDENGNVKLSKEDSKFKDITFAWKYLKIWFKKEFERKI